MQKAPRRGAFSHPGRVFPACNANWPTGLQTLLDAILSRAPQWRGLAEHEWQSGNPAILEELPPELRTNELDLEACQLVANLREALATFSAR